LIKLQEKIDKQSIRQVRWYQKGADSVEIPIPVLGPDLMDPRRYAEIRQLASQKPDEPQVGSTTPSAGV
jgi:NADH-quinone oxidoreductase subunit B